MFTCISEYVGACRESVRRHYVAMGPPYNADQLMHAIALIEPTSGEWRRVDGVLTWVVCDTGYWPTLELCDAAGEPVAAIPGRPRS